tara:strand:+ start:17499 stop:18017 length:519 start_codon:yes stop_codon:yes gene_type:complete
MIKTTKIEPSSNDSIKDVKDIKPNCFIVVSHPNCHYCNLLEPTKNELFKTLNKSYTGDLDILDIHGDSVPSLIDSIPELKEVDGYPTILAKSDSKDPVVYNGDRSLDSLMKFLKDNFEIKKLTKTSVSKKGGTKSKSKCKSKCKKCKCKSKTKSKSNKCKCKSKSKSNKNKL